MADTKTDYADLIQRRSDAMHQSREIIESYYRVRQALGYLGLFLPFGLIASGLLSNAQLEPSVSDFFHTFSRDVFVGTMCAIGIFLISYNGYDRKPGESLSDNWLATIAGLSAFGVALFPNESPSGDVSTLTQLALGINYSPIVHYSSALIFFYCLGHFCFFRFAKTKNLKRRRIYIICGWIITFSGIMIGVASYFKKAGSPAMSSFVIDYNIVFWVEAIGIWAFALSWLVKGHADQSILLKARVIKR